jgi:hypothetical protein
MGWTVRSLLGVGDRAECWVGLKDRVISAALISDWHRWVLEELGSVFRKLEAESSLELRCRQIGCWDTVYQQDALI